MTSKLLISTLLFISFLSFGKDKLEVIGCWDTGSALCSQVSKQREYSRFLAQTDASEALSDSDSAILNYVIQSDTSNTVTHFKFHVYKDQEWAEGPDGHDMFYPVTRIRMISETGIYGAAKADIERAVSPRVATEQFIEKYGNKGAVNGSGSEVIRDSNGYIDYDSACGPTGIHVLAREAWNMRQNCHDFMVSIGMFSGVKEIELLISTTESIAGNVESGIEGIISAGLEAKVDYTQAQKVTIRANRPLHFNTPDGYKIILFPNPNGEAEVVSFYLPNGIKIPVDPDGSVKLKEAAEELLSGKYNVTKDNLIFIQLMNKRMNHLALRRLEALLNAGLQCDRCTVTIVDEMTE
ncbi:hypothetical protein [Pseudoalteromonas sp. MTN2-4]|uniref:hypothetical protein n=1 Tax=Pseudoalteromonas sp. MTN2-4 TaxID=3056555 RepID=UPI0036F3FA99